MTISNATATSTSNNVNASDGTMQTEGEAPDSSDIPPHNVKSLGSATLTPSVKTLTPNMKALTPDAVLPTNGHPVAIPPAEAGAYDKAPGHTRSSLQKLVTAIPATAPSPQVQPQRPRSSSKPYTNGINGANHNHIGSNSSSNSSPTGSDSDWGSQPSTRPPSQLATRPGRAPSMSAGTSGGKITGLVKPLPDSTPASPVVPGRGKPASVHSDSGHKFNLKDLLGTAPKLARKSSHRSASSRKSDSDYDGVGGGAAKSITGDSTMSLSQKYGVCQKVAIGKGATSVVRLAHKWHRDPREEKLYAVKEFRKRRKNETEKEYIKKLTAEFCISSTLHHDNVVETVDLVQDEAHNWCEVMEFCPGGDLYAAIKKGGMSPSEVECCFKQLLSGVGYLHTQGVAHRDIKPENIFFDAKGKLKIGDYGASTVYRLPWEATIHMSTGLCGSEPYIAPEQFLGKPYDARLVDVWACGIVYYCLHFQELPWRAAQQSDTHFQSYAVACANSSPNVSSCPPTINNLSPRPCRSLIRKMLEPDPKHRATIDDALNHAWVNTIEICWRMEKPLHIHGHAQALAAAQRIHVAD